MKNSFPIIVPSPICWCYGLVYTESLCVDSCETTCYHTHQMFRTLLITSPGLYGKYTYRKVIKFWYRGPICIQSMCVDSCMLYLPPYTSNIQSRCNHLPVLLGKYTARIYFTKMVWCLVAVQFHHNTINSLLNEDFGARNRYLRQG